MSTRFARSVRPLLQFPRFRPVTALLALCLSLTACSLFVPPLQTRGNKVDPDQLKELVPGTSSKADVTSLIGSPTQKATFDENTWLYITETTRPRVGRTLGVLDQHVVALTFDDRGILTGVKQYGMADARPVAVATQTTPSPGTEASFMQQLIGNIGRYNPTGTGGFTAGPGNPNAGTGGL